MNGTESIYRHHHSSRRGEDFILLGEERGTFLKERIGTGKKVLDIGCRDGVLTKKYCEGNDVLGIDIDTVALNRAKEQLGIEVLHVDLNGSWDEIPKEAFGAVVAGEVMEHLYYPDLVFSKIAATLKPGGILLGTVPNAFSIKNRIRLLFLQKKNTPLSDPTHINHFVVSELVGLLKKDFSQVEIIGVGKYTWLAKTFPQLFAYDLFFAAQK